MPPRKKAAAKKRAPAAKRARTAEAPADEDARPVLGTTEGALQDRFAASKAATEYAQFHAWVERSLEAARADLAGALFPVFAHCYCSLVDEGRTSDALQFLERWAPSHADRYASSVESLRRASSKAAAKKDPFRKRLASSKFKVALGAAARDLLGDFLIRCEHTLVLRILNEFVEVEDKGPGGEARLVDEDIELARVCLGVPTRSELEAPGGLAVPDFSTPYGAARRPLR